MKSLFVKGSALFGVLMFLAASQLAYGQVRSAADKALGYYGPAAGPAPMGATMLGGRSVAPTYVPAAPAMTSETPRSYSYAPAPKPKSAQPAPPVRRAPATAPARRYSYQPSMRVYNAPATDRIFYHNPVDRKASAKALGEY